MIRFNDKLSASITVEASISFTFTIFILFLMIGPLLIIKTTSDILVKLNKASKVRCNYEMTKEKMVDTDIGNKVKGYIDDITFLKDNIEGIESIADTGSVILSLDSEYDENKREYRSLNYIYNRNESSYLSDTGEVFYDFVFEFSLPYNVLHVDSVYKRIVNNRRAFIGIKGDRFSSVDESGDFVYVANNHINSNIYHLFIDCTYLEKNTESEEYSEVLLRRNESNRKYAKCDYCFKGIEIRNNTICYITQYGDRFHYKNNCPLMTAYITKIPKIKIEGYNLILCSRCNKREME